jgi:hypothetical protein
MAAPKGRFTETLTGRQMLTALSAFGAVAIWVLVPSVSQSDGHRVGKAAVLERGIFQAVNEGWSLSYSTVGPVRKVRDVSLIQNTTVIPARRSVRFGLRYVITGAPVGARTEIKIITRFPDVGLLNPDSGVRHLQSEYTIQTVIGQPAYREFRFDQSWEMVPGEWVFEFWHAGRKLGAQKFCVIEDAEGEPSNQSPTFQCGPLIG